MEISLLPDYPGSKNPKVWWHKSFSKVAKNQALICKTGQPSGNVIWHHLRKFHKHSTCWPAVVQLGIYDTGQNAKRHLPKATTARIMCNFEKLQKAQAQRCTTLPWCTRSTKTGAKSRDPWDALQDTAHWAPLLYLKRGSIYTHMHLLFKNCEPPGIAHLQFQHSGRWRRQNHSWGLGTLLSREQNACPESAERKNDSNNGRTNCKFLNTGYLSERRERRE